MRTRKRKRRMNFKKRKTEIELRMKLKMGSRRETLKSPRKSRPSKPKRLTRLQPRGLRTKQLTRTRVSKRKMMIKRRKRTSKRKTRTRTMTMMRTFRKPFRMMTGLKIKLRKTLTSKTSKTIRRRNKM